MVIICTPEEKKSLMRIFTDDSVDCPFPLDCPPCSQNPKDRLEHRCKTCVENAITWVDEKVVIKKE